MDELTPEVSVDQIVDAIADSDSISASNAIKTSLFAKASEAITTEKEKIGRKMFEVLPTEEEG
jgi:hypothetical protein